MHEMPGFGQQARQAGHVDASIGSSFALHSAVSKPSWSERARDATRRGENASVTRYFSARVHHFALWSTRPQLLSGLSSVLRSTLLDVRAFGDVLSSQHHEQRVTRHTSISRTKSTSSYLHAVEQASVWNERAPSRLAELGMMISDNPGAEQTVPHHSWRTSLALAPHRAQPL